MNRHRQIQRTEACRCKKLASVFVRLVGIIFDIRQCLRDKMGMTAQCVLQLFQKGSITGLSGSQALLILNKQSHYLTIQYNKIFLYESTSYRRQTNKLVIVRTRVEMMPLCFSSIRSQMILLSKYCTVSHWHQRRREQHCVSAEVQIPISSANFFGFDNPSSNRLTAIPSASYSSCSDLRVSSMNSCCSFSLQ